jgi:hypothetical protein
MSSEDTRSDAEPAPTGLGSVLLEVARNLRSPPLLFAYGVIIAIVLAAVVAGDRLGSLQVPVVALGVLALVAWSAIEIVRARRRVAPGVDVGARRVAAGGEVSGVEGLPADRDVPDVRVRADDVGGSVKGVVYGPRDGERGESDRE